MGVASSAAIIAAQAAAREAHTAACRQTVGTFHAEGTTVTEAREYASCVEYLYPQPMTDYTILAVKCVIVILLIAAVLGLLKGSDMEERVMFFFFFPLFTFIGLGVVAGIFCGLYFVFTA